MINIDKKCIRSFSMMGTRNVYGLTCLDIASIDKKMIALSADMTIYSGLERFASTFNNRIFNLGIAEQNLIGVASGLSNEGFNVFASTYAAFATTRALDQVKVNMSYMKIPIKLIGLASGFSQGTFGNTHVSIEDIAIMRSLPNITILSPADGLETYKCVMEASKLNFPVYIRLTGVMYSDIVYTEDYNYEIGKSICIKDGKDIVIIATGSMVYLAKKVSEMLDKDGISAKVVDMHTIKPLDKDVISEAEETSKLVVTIEEHNVIGGLGSAVAEVISSNSRVKLLKIGVDDYWPLPGDYKYQLESVGLTENNIYNRIKNKYDNLYKI